MTSSFIHLTRDGNVATVTITRLERRNAINRAMLRELGEVCQAFADDEQTRAMIVRAAGTYLCAQRSCHWRGSLHATARDSRIAATSARVGYGEVKLGMNLMRHAVPSSVHLV